MPSRRSVVVSAILLVLAAVTLAACGGSSTSSSSSTPTNSSEKDVSSEGGSGAPDLSGTTLSYVGFGGTVDEGVKKAWMEPFEEETGVKFTLEAPTEYSKIQTQVETGNVANDIVDGDQFFVEPECGKLFEPIHVSQDGVLPEFKTKGKCSVPDFVFGIGMFYQESAFPQGGPENCQDFFDTKKFPGKRVIWNYVADAAILECAAIAEGANPKDPYPIDINKAFAKLETIKSDLADFSSPSQATDGMVNGDAPIYLTPTNRYVVAIEQGAEYATSKGFAAKVSGAFGIPKGAPHAEAAEAWFEYIMQKQVNQRITEAAPPYFSVFGGEAPASWSPIAKETNVISGPLSKVAFTNDQEWWAEHYDEVSTRFAELLAG